MKKTVEEIARLISRKKVVFFLGAGISRNPPSGLPLSAEFNTIILKTLQKKIRKKLSGKDFNRLANIRLESYFTQLNSLLKGDIYRLIQAIKGASCNSIHHFIGALYRAGYVRTSLTTNFDDLIELSTGNSLSVLHHPDDYIALQSNFHTLKLYKLHGSLDSDEQRMKESIRISLKQVSSPMESGKMKVLRDTIQNNHVVFLGYSGLDDFDIYPVLLKTSSRYSYYWVNHTSGNTTPYVNANLSALVKKRQNCFILNTDTTGFIKAVARKLNIQIPKTQVSSVINIAAQIEQAVKSSDLCKAPNHVIGKLFGFLNDQKKCLSYYNLSLQANEMPIPYLLRDIGVTNVRLGNYDMAISNFKECLKYEKGTALEAAHRLNIGYSYYQKYKVVKRHKRYLQLAERYLRQASKVPGITVADLSYSLNNLSLVKIEQRAYIEALSLLNESIRLKKKIGEVRAIGRSFSIKGDIYSFMNEPHKALYFYNKALALQQKVQDKEGIYASLLNKAEHFTRQGNNGFAIKTLNQANLLLKS